MEGPIAYSKWKITHKMPYYIQVNHDLYIFVDDALIS